VVVKGTSLMGLSLPFSFYASEALAGWLRGRLRPWLTAALLALAFCVALSCTFDLVFQKTEEGRAATLLALAICVVLSCTFDLVFEKTEVSGLPWSPAEGG
jgi:peptidoglycan/LPS O-acetylase OafA/YrhL